MSKEISSAIVELADELEKYITIVDKKPVVKEGAYIENLTGGATAEMVQKVVDHDSIFLPAIKLAYGRVSQAAMEVDDTIDALSVEIPMGGRNHFDMTYSRQQTFPTPGSGEPITKYGVIKSNLVTQSAIASRGEMSRVRDFLSAEALKAFAS